MPSQAIDDFSIMALRVLVRAVFVTLPFTGVVSAIPSVTLPINSQLPPVAIVGQLFNFTFSSSTFATSGGTLTYSLSKQPSWLQLDAGARCLWGQPTSEDQGIASFDIQATDITGSTSDHVKLIVSDDPGPIVGDSVSKQLAKFGAFIEPNTLLVYPSSSVYIQFDQDTFTSVNSSTKYFIIGSDRTPLPSWLHFDSTSLVLRGQTPAFTSPAELPQNFDVGLVASDIAGFSQAAVTFRITVESHHIVFNQSTVSLSILPGDIVNSSSLSRNLQLDGKPIAPGNITVASSSLPEWLQIDNQTLTLSGVVPDDARDSNSTVIVADDIGDMATATVRVLLPTDSGAPLIEGQFRPIELYIGSSFNYTFDRSDFAPNASIEIDAGTLSSWMHFDNSSLALWGAVPDTESPQQTRVKAVVSVDSKVQDDEITVALLESIPSASDASSTISVSSISTASMSSDVGSQTNTDEPSNRSPPNTPKQTTRRLALIITLPILGAVLFCILIFLIIRKRRLTEGEHSHAHAWNDKNGTGPDALQMSRHRQIFPRIDRGSAVLPCNRCFLPGVRRSQDLATTTLPSSPAQKMPPVVRPQRPPSSAPQVGRIVLERDPDPFREWVESESLTPSENTAPGVQRRSVTEFQQGSPSIPRSTELSSADHQRHLINERPSLRDSVHGPLSSHRSRSASCLDTGTWNMPNQNDSFISRWSDGPYSEGRSKTGMGSYATTASPIRTDEISDSMEPITTDDPSSVDFLRSGSNVDRFRGSTVRPVTPSNKSTPLENSQRGSKSSVKKSSYKGSRSSHSSRRSGQRISSSPIKRGSQDFSHQLALHIKRRRQHPSTARFSNLHARSSATANAGFDFLQKKIDDMSALAGVQDQQSSELLPSPIGNLTPGSSRPRGEILGQQMHSVFASLKESSSMRSKSSVATSEVSFQNIERQMEETEEQANYARQFGGQRRSSWHRLSALPESQGLGAQDVVLKLRNPNVVSAEPKEMKSLQSTSCKGEVSGCKSDSEKDLNQRDSLGKADNVLEESEKHFL